MLKTFLIGLVLSSSFAPALQNESPHLMEPRTALVIPESGFISSHHYTNAYFGFGLPLPKGHFGIVDISHDMWALRHDLLFVQSMYSGLAISATPVLDSAEDEARRISLMGTRSHAGTKIINIDGRPFWKSELAEEAIGIDTRYPARKWWRASYAIALRGFVVHFWASSYDEKVEKSYSSASSRSRSLIQILHSTEQNGTSILFCRKQPDCGGRVHHILTSIDWVQETFTATDIPIPFSASHMFFQRVGTRMMVQPPAPWNGLEGG